MGCVAAVQTVIYDPLTTSADITCEVLHFKAYFTVIIIFWFKKREGDV